MKIAYGTYAMPETRLEEAIPLLAGIGYDGIEICVSPSPSLWKKQIILLKPPIMQEKN
tara:strand:+ start:272 stop:445 length:174 start_codon:yes stop_codon:yes gene_type:complete